MKFYIIGNVFLRDKFDVTFLRDYFNVLLCIFFQRQNKSQCILILSFAVWTKSLINFIGKNLKCMIFFFVKVFAIDFTNNDLDIILDDKYNTIYLIIFNASPLFRREFL